MYPSPQTTALLLAVMLKRAGKTRARISEKTLRQVARRKTLRDAFVSEVHDRLEDFGIVGVSLERGGYAVVAISALEGAPVVTAREHLVVELKAQKDGKLSESKLWSELGLEYEDDAE
jgi:hypothetical protein